MRKTDIFIVTGPTGGHFFPGLALGENISKISNYKITFAVPKRDYLIKWLEKKNFSYVLIPEAKLIKKNFFYFPFKFFYSFLYSLNNILKENPTIVFGTGSYVSLPFIFASKVLRKKIIIHEQNFSLGKANRILSLISYKVALTFPNKKYLFKRKFCLTGFPLIEEFKKRYNRQEILKEFGFEKEKTTILVMGGSQGAQFINCLIEENLYYFKNKNFQFIHLSGKNKEKLEKSYEKYGIKAKVFDFFSDMDKIYNITDMAICRAGAGTLAELCEWKIPSLLIPLPIAGGHQNENANYLFENGACLVLNQNFQEIKKFPFIFEEFLGKISEIKRSLEKINLSDTNNKLTYLILNSM